MTKPRTAQDYEDEVTAASRVGLAEIMTALGAYRDALVLIGGWAPYLILERFGEEGAGFTHVGSIDIDFVVDPEIIDADRYATIVELLRSRGYEPVRDSLFQFQRTILSPRSGRSALIRVDFLTPKPLEQGRSRRHREVQHDLRARTLEGAEVALVVGSLALKGLAIGERYAEKDAYDIFALCAHCRGGPAAVADAVRPFRAEEPVRRGLAAIAEKFRDKAAEGPTWVAVFLSEGNADADERTRVDAFMTVQEVLRLVAK